MRIDQITKKMSQMNMSIIIFALLAYSLFGVWMTGVQGAHLITSLQGQHVSSEALQISMIRPEKVPLSQAELQKVADKIAPSYKDVMFTVTGDGLEFKIKDLQKYDEFKEVISDIKGVSGVNVRWSATKFCAGGQCGDASYSAALQGYVLKFN